MKKIWIVVLFLMLVAPCSSINGVDGQEVSWGNLPPVVDTDETPVVEPVVDPIPVVDEGPKVRKMGDLTWRQRRKLGLTVRNVIRVTREMKKAGDLEGVSQAELSAMILNQLMTENPKVYADPSLDWDALLDFIERLIPIILKIMSLFMAI